MSWTLSVQASVLPLPYHTTYLYDGMRTGHIYIYKYIYIYYVESASRVRGRESTLDSPRELP